MKFRRLLSFAFLCAFALAPLAQAADISITAASVLPSANAKFRTGTAGQAITAGQTVYRYTTGGTTVIELADANLGNPAAYKVDGIAVNSAGIGQLVRYCYYDPHFTFGGTTTVGAILIQSATGGGVAPSTDAASGMYISFLGVATSTSTIFLNITRSDVAKP